MPLAASPRRRLVRYTWRFRIESDEPIGCKQSDAGSNRQGRGNKRYDAQYTGGKHPGDLDTYCKAVGDGDFMLIVANWVDSHPEGLVYAAKEFRDTIDRK